MPRDFSWPATGLLAIGRPAHNPGSGHTGSSHVLWCRTKWELFYFAAEFSLHDEIAGFVVGKRLEADSHPAFGWLYGVVEARLSVNENLNIGRRAPILKRKNRRRDWRMVRHD